MPSGVLRTEIYTDASKVAVVGNVDAGILLKRLSKVGKTAELILPEAAQKPRPEEEERKPDEPNKKKIHGGGGNSGSVGGDAENPKPEGTANSGDSMESRNGSSGDGGGKKEVRGLSESLADRPVMASHARVHCPMEAISLPIAVSAYPAPAACCFDGHYCYELPVHRAPATAAAAGYGNYYSDDDGVGCCIM